MDWIIVGIIHCWSGSKWLDACLFERKAENKVEVCQTKTPLIITGITLKKDGEPIYECTTIERREDAHTSRSH